ncbi:MAG: EF-hand domain-containing protein [Hyphomicrobiales bacterium]|nr:EF-hand domain-containing protein [Hyphomicrobiales bacterium]
MEITSSAAALSLAEMQKLHQQRFVAADTDGSGGLSLEEFEAVGQNLPSGGQKPPDAPTAAEIFSEIDADGDGNLTQEELLAHFQKVESRTQGALLQEQSAQPTGGPPPGGPPPGGPPPGGGEIEDLVSLLSQLSELDDGGETLLSSLLGDGESADGALGDGESTSLAERLAANLRDYITQLYESRLESGSDSPSEVETTV